MKVIQDKLSSNVWIGQSAYTVMCWKDLACRKPRSVITTVDMNDKLTKFVEDDELFDRRVYLFAACCICQQAQ